MTPVTSAVLQLEYGKLVRFYVCQVPNSVVVGWYSVSHLGPSGLETETLPPGHCSPVGGRDNLYGPYAHIKEALDFFGTLDDSDLDDIDTEFAILPSDPDALSNTEDIDDSSTRKIEETMCDDQYIINVHCIL
ncbi:hypothetical protein AVEN_213539-1 [Araneus ventricosus]|uniref:Uncharacterized protein n=1 Tax=Araneus ventricosus TaxID=182803 RepID=A0A4Y2TGU0_ARAVE|nr:hypothetical protein AVEN_130751-1 [Araneus ventricosus]GBN99466.1 hypothetical protein AVEN_213539-1 [Araneus ventricosus]